MKSGYIHSFQSLGTVDGPGVRFVVFFQGCNLRCKCCHNPDTWDKIGNATLMEASEVAERVQRYKEYFKAEGGITISGGEPLLQAGFARDIFACCKKAGINTCLDTSGSIINASVEELFSFTDRVLLDIKYTEDSLYRANVGCPISVPLAFLDLLEKRSIPTTVRQVIIPTVNDSEDSVRRLTDMAYSHRCVDKIELLPFRKLCTTKYDKMKIEFPFASIPVPTAEKMQRLMSLTEKTV